MKIIIAGSRTVTDPGLVSYAMRVSGAEGVVTCVLSGGAKGVDMLGEMWANVRMIPVERHPANWDAHGKKAGYMRNVEMAETAGGLVAIWDGVSKGTKHMIDIAGKKGMMCYVLKVPAL